MSDWWLAYWISNARSNDNNTVYYKSDISYNVVPKDDILFGVHISQNVKHYLIIYVGIACANIVSS